MTDSHHGPAFDLEEIPFSCSGSWFNLSPVTALHTRSRDLHLVSHKNGMHPVLRLVPRIPDTGDRADASRHAVPGLLVLEADGGRIEITYENPDTLRLRGTGLNLAVTPADDRLTPFTGSYLYQDPVDGSYQFSSYETGRRYRITLLQGAAADVTGAEGLADTPRRITLAGTPVWEAVLEEMDSARLPFTTDSDFTARADRARRGFRDFSGELTAPVAGSAPAAGLAAYVLWSATVRPQGYLRRPAVLMSKHWMDKVWSWDHCFNALALARAAPELAWDQYQLTFDHQDETGALPDSVTHSEVLYNFVKPPIHGWALRRLRERLPEPLTADRLEAAYGRLKRWTGFWLDSRRAPGQVLPHYQHGNDSGWDNATVFDPGRVLITADLAAFLVLQLRELSGMAAELGHVREADGHAATATAVLDALLEQLWDGERFLARSPHTGRTSSSRSLLDLMPVVLGDLLPGDVSARLAEGVAAHLTEHGLATEHPDSPHYEADGYWRGPVWAPSTVLIEDGLRRAGHTDLADTVSSRFRRLCERSGFAENFDALTGEGLRDRAYTWTAGSYLLLADDHARRTTGRPDRAGHPATDPTSARTP
ncbi:amylo-alpha-1,6-glucosidase [Peterkaempfera griseoplana]|uniref:amylo-alpha-1,6-glucosidase n=1 Tax=Peterkaempfera griseoplana TaxID=66896 RepID=UPI0006E3D58A|nr:trehalase family glycosidase [Peterkaempfera griseoplana]